MSITYFENLFYISEQYEHSTLRIFNDWGSSDFYHCFGLTSVIFTEFWEPDFVMYTFAFIIKIILLQFLFDVNRWRYNYHTEVKSRHYSNNGSSLLKRGFFLSFLRRSSFAFILKRHVLTSFMHLWAFIFWGHLPTIEHKRLTWAKWKEKEEKIELAIRWKTHDAHLQLLEVSSSSSTLIICRRLGKIPMWPNSGKSGIRIVKGISFRRNCQTDKIKTKSLFSNVSETDLSTSLWNNQEWIIKDFIGVNSMSV